MEDPRLQTPNLQDPRLQDPRLQDPRLQDPRLQDPRLQDPRYRAQQRQEPAPPQAPGYGGYAPAPQQPQPQPRQAPPHPPMHPQQAAAQSAPRAAPDPQARWHDPHGGTHHPAYDPGYSALDQAVDVPHRPSPGPDYLPVDPVSRGYQDPRGPQPAHGWSEAPAAPGRVDAQPQYAQPPQYGQAPQYAQPHQAPPMPQAPPRMPRAPQSQADFDDDSRLTSSLPPWLRGAAATLVAGAGAAMAAASTGIASLRARRAEKQALQARERARDEAARAADALDAADYVQEPGKPGKRAPRQPGQKLTAKEKRWQRRRRRHVVEEIIGWIVVPIILVALYFALIGGLALFGLTLDDLMDGLRMIRAQFS